LDPLHAATDSYPGTQATPREILALASAYADAVQALFKTARKSGALSHAPARLCAIHATELFEMTHRREYLISRYGPEQMALHTELTRLTATMTEVQSKVTALLSWRRGFTANFLRTSSLSTLHI